MSTPEQLLQQALELSKRTLELAEKEEWAAINKLDAERMECLKACFESESGISDKPSAAAIVKEILEINQKVSNTAGGARKELEESLLSLRKGRAATDAYKNSF